MMTVKARKQGNSLMVTIPAEIHMQEGTEFHVVEEENGVISFVPVHQNIFAQHMEYDVKAGIRSLDLGDNGSTVGKENVW